MDRIYSFAVWLAFAKDILTGQFLRDRAASSLGCEYQTAPVRFGKTQSKFPVISSESRLVCGLAHHVRLPKQDWRDALLRVQQETTRGAWSRH